MIEQRTVAILSGLKLIEEIGEQRHVKRIDLRHFRELLGIAAVVRQRMMRLGNADLGISSRAGFASELKRDDPGDVSLQSQHLQVEHQARVVRISGRYAEGAVQIEARIGRLGLRLLNAALHFANRVEILTDLVAVAGPELPLKARDIFAYPIEKAGVFAQLHPAICRAAALAEQPLENDA